MPLYLDRRLFLTANKIKYISTANQLQLLSSDVLYIITENIDMGTTSIEVPENGLTIESLGTEVASLSSNEDNYSLFTSPINGSGNFTLNNIRLDISGTNSKVFDVTGATGSEAFTSKDVVYSNCTSRGSFSNFRQGYENEVYMIGGTPSLTLNDTWSGGWVTTNALVRNLTSSMTSSLFEEGTDFLMNSRFRININCDLPSSATFCTFTSDNFTNPSLVDVETSIFTRDGLFVSGDGNYFPHLDPEDLVCLWRGNNGLRSTVEGGYLELTTEVTTNVSDTTTPVDIEGVFTASELAHFTQPTNNVLQHNGNNPTQYEVSGSLALDSDPNDILNVLITKWSEDLQTWSSIKTYTVVVNSIVGARDVGFLTFSRRIILENGDRVKLQVVNTSNNNSIVLEEDSYMQVRRS